MQLLRLEEERYPGTLSQTNNELVKSENHKAALKMENVLLTPVLLFTKAPYCQHRALNTFYLFVATTKKK